MAERKRQARHAHTLVAGTLALLALTACRAQPPAPAGAPAAGAAERYVPGLGEIMTLQQMRHTKLWLAGQAGNWPLAAYEADELQEGFDAVVEFHPTHKDSPVAPKDAIPRMVTAPMGEVRASVEAKDPAAFVRAYDSLTAACNRCHQATNFGFNVVQRPADNPYPNQVFAPASR